jgi:hypothetical protein
VAQAGEALRQPSNSASAAHRQALLAAGLAGHPAIADPNRPHSQDHET